MKEAQLERTSDPDDHLLITPRLHSHHIGRKNASLPLYFNLACPFWLHHFMPQLVHQSWLWQNKS